MDIVRTPTEVIVTLRGSFDAEAVSAAGARWEQLPHGSEGNVCLDLTDVTFIDSCAIGTITFLFKRLAAQGRKLCLRGVSGQPRKLLEFLRIDRVIEVTPRAPGRFAARPGAVAGTADGTVV